MILALIAARLRQIAASIEPSRKKTVNVTFQTSWYRDGL